MVECDAALGQDLLEIAVGHGVADLEEDRMQDHIPGKLSTFERHHAHDLIDGERPPIDHRRKVCDRTKR